MSKPAFIVDGFTEKNVLSHLCPGKPISRTDLNGKSVTILAMSNKIASLVRLFGNKHYPIIVIVDREQRVEDCKTLENMLLFYLKEQGLKDQDIRITFADRMFENWIIADWESLGLKTPKPLDTDGINGSSLLKKELGSFHKTTDGVNLFLQASAEEIYKNSPSFKSFADSIEDVACQHLKFDK